MSIRIALILGLTLLILTGGGYAEEADKAKQEAEKKVLQKKELKLEELFPEKSVFGPSASAAAFSYDGHYGAWLYRPYDERRHGTDLYLYDTQTGALKRITAASVMAPFQQSAKKVVEDRIAKVKKERDKKAAADKEAAQAKKSDEDTGEKTKTEKTEKEEGDRKEHKDRRKKEQKKEKETQSEPGMAGVTPAGDDEQAAKESNDKKTEARKSDSDELEARKDRGDWVDDKDADAKDAPRYSGVTSFLFSPVADELLLVSEGDIYLYRLADEKLERLTQTRESERNLAWLEDGSGYLYMQGSALMKVRPGESFVQQINPKLPDGQELAGYELSPNGRYLALLTSKEIKPGQASKVDIVNYRDRMMKAREVERHVSDDQRTIIERRAFLYRISEPGREDDRLVEVFELTTDLPSSMLRGLSWSPDSQRVAFMSYEEESRLVRFYQAETDILNEADKDKAGEKDDSNPDPNKARQIYEFLHTGGPNTPDMMDLYYLADNKTLVYLSEQTGFRHLNKLDPLYESFSPLTKGSFEVYPFKISQDRRWIFASATKEHPSRLDIYRIATSNGKMTRLTHQVGVHSNPAVSPDGTRVLANLVSYQFLKELVYIDTKKDVHQTLTDSHPDKAREFAQGHPEFFDYPNRLGQTIYGQVFLPDDWSKEDKRPVLIYFYGGPLGTSKQVVEANYYGSAYAFPWYMAQEHGYIACTIDPRGNSGYAGVFEKANFGQVGKPQVEDLADGVKYLVAHYGADPNRVAIHGWSFGGFQTQMCMYTEPDVFAAGIAGAGPTEWENYNSWYTTRTIGISEPGKETLKAFSLLPLAKNLKGKLLLVHGMEDDNVLYQDTVNVYRELLKAGKETLVELFLDPTGKHGLGGDVKNLSRYRKYEDFLIKAVGEGQPAVKPAADDTQEKPAKKPVRKPRKPKTESGEKSKDSF